MYSYLTKVVEGLRKRGKIAPSSQYLVKSMIGNIDFEKDLNILQLGFGTGVFTREILKRSTKNSRVTVLEIDSSCRKFIPNDIRLDYREESAENIPDCFPEESFDIIVSTLPFGSLPKEITQNILSFLPCYLKTDGLFLQFQYSLLHKKAIEKAFQRKICLSFEVRNLPPACIYTLRK